MKWLRLLALLRKMPIKELLNYPKDITDSAACRKWVLAVLESLEVVAELTDMEVDDEVIKTVQGVVNNETTWDLIHGLFVSFISGDDHYNEELAMQERADVHGFNPMFIMVIIQAVALLLKLFKSRK